MSSVSQGSYTTMPAQALPRLEKPSAVVGGRIDQVPEFLFRTPLTGPAGDGGALFAERAEIWQLALDSLF